MRGVAPSIPWCCTGARVARTVHPAAAAVATLRVTCLGLQNGAGEHLATRWCCSTPSSAPTLPSPCRRRTYMVRLCCARGFNDGFHLVLWRRLALDGGPINGDRVQADATVHAPSTLSCCMPPCVGCGPSPIVTLPWPAQCKKVLSSFLGYQGWSSSVVQLTRLPAPSPSSRSCVSVRFQAEVEVLFTRCGLLVTGIGEAVVDTERSYGTAIEVRDNSSVHALAACQGYH